MKEENHTIKSIDTERFDKIQQIFMIKAPNKPRIKENFLNMTKGIYGKPTDNVISNFEKLKAFPI